MIDASLPDLLNKLRLIMKKSMKNNDSLGLEIVRIKPNQIASVNFVK